MNSNQKNEKTLVYEEMWTPRTFVDHEGINMNKAKTHLLINLPGKTILRVHQNLIKKILGIEFVPAKPTNSPIQAVQAIQDIKASEAIVMKRKGKKKS